MFEKLSSKAQNAKESLASTPVPNTEISWVGSLPKRSGGIGSVDWLPAEVKRFLFSSLNNFAAVIGGVPWNQAPLKLRENFLGARSFIYFYKVQQYA